jgi:hypothetical protein
MLVDRASDGASGLFGWVLAYRHVWLPEIELAARIGRAAPGGFTQWNARA